MPKTPTIDEIMGGAPGARVDAPPADEDAETPWACVQPEGPRTRNNDGSLHPIFRSDRHLDPHATKLIRCPACGSSSVRIAFEGEDDTPPPEPKRDPRLLEMERAGFYRTGSRP